ncbi:hypothetical protein [Streptomyces sp. CBMA156]|uniref:hypothetical protein n=1 Tax=Streptomyces sp. CBMA156 TaxID=1930280 RepID=UPI001661C5F1|nr:hypothetical protein [Streptomyces sp. CBMA156]MBD0670052.1 hypothetical protein [Streptomyces sp. CBMA156]
MNLVMQALVENIVGEPKPYGWIITRDLLDDGEASAEGTAVAGLRCRVRLYGDPLQEQQRQMGELLLRPV